ncbi:uncharacterized protein [Epargyreus clarus]|uniref:uncharacterized protein n=1 Tax=Epargyreus clarus TaxID=520877 RepID=UPI003C2CA42A
MTSLILLKSMLFASALRKSKKKKMVKKSKKSTGRDPELKICRICNQERGDIPIFNNFLQPNIPEEIKNISGVTIIKTDNLSKKMCKNCLDLLNGCIMFREMCQKSNKKLIEASIKKEQINYEGVNSQKSAESFQIPSPIVSDYNPKWECSSCKKEFLDLVSYKGHLKKCSKSLKPKPTEQQKPEEIKKSFLCDICGKTARSNANLLVHMSTHENIFPFKCESCPYQGRTLDLLKVHKRSHLADKPFKCTQCPKATTTASNLAKHMRHVHSTNRPYKCTYCDRGFSYQHDMKRHVRDLHLRQGTVECDICSKKFMTKKILYGHRWKIHKIKGERHGRLPSYLQCQMERVNQSNDRDAAL